MANVVTWNDSEAVLVKEPSAFKDFTYDNETDTGILQKLDEVKQISARIKMDIREIQSNYNYLVSKYDAFSDYEETMDVNINRLDASAESFDEAFVQLISVLQDQLLEHMKEDSSLIDDIDGLNELLLVDSAYTALNPTADELTARNASYEAAYEFAVGGKTRRMIKQESDPTVIGTVLTGLSSMYFGVEDYFEGLFDYSLLYYGGIHSLITGDTELYDSLKEYVGINLSASDSQNYFDTNPFGVSQKYHSYVFDTVEKTGIKAGNRAASAAVGFAMPGTGNIVNGLSAAGKGMEASIQRGDSDGLMWANGGIELASSIVASGINSKVSGKIDSINNNMASSNVVLPWATKLMSNGVTNNVVEMATPYAYSNQPNVSKKEHTTPIFEPVEAPMTKEEAQVVTITTKEKAQQQTEASYTSSYKNVGTKRHDANGHELYDNKYEEIHVYDNKPDSSIHITTKGSDTVNK